MGINASFFNTAKKQTIHFYYEFAVIVDNLRRLIVDVVITGNAESQSAELCLQMVFVCLSQARSKYRSNRGSCRRKFSALAYVAGDFVLFLRSPPFFSLKKSYSQRLKLRSLSIKPHKQTNERKRRVKKKKKIKKNSPK